MNERTIAYLTLASAVIGLAVRLLKTDAGAAMLERIGFPKRYLGWLALLLGALGYGVAAMLNGKAWPDAVVEMAKGLTAGAGAVVGHELVIEAIRDGKELPLKPPPGASVFLGVMLFVLASIVACAAWPVKRVDVYFAAEAGARDAGLDAR